MPQMLTCACHQSFSGSIDSISSFVTLNVGIQRGELCRSPYAAAAVRCVLFEAFEQWGPAVSAKRALVAGDEALAGIYLETMFADLGWLCAMVLCTPSLRGEEYLTASRCRFFIGPWEAGLM